MKRDVTLKPRKQGNLPPEKLKKILSGIYTKETVEELMLKLCGSDGERKDDGNEETD